MIADFLGAVDWSTPPCEMEVNLPYSSLIEAIAAKVSHLNQARPSLSEWERNASEAVSLYVMAPGIVNVMLNYKICV